MHFATLNIGHDVPDSSRFLQQPDILNILKGYGLSLHGFRISRSHTELTTIVTVGADSLESIIGAVYLASRALGQDCIAVVPTASHLAGLLVGPNAHPWGPFDPAFFITL